MPSKANVNQTFQSPVDPQRSQNIRTRARRRLLTLSPTVSTSSANSNLLIRGKSSDSVSTGTAVTAPEDDMNSGNRIQGPSSPNIGPAAPLHIASRHSRSRIERRRDPRHVREPPVREPNIRNGLPILSGNATHRTEGLSENRQTEHARKDKGKETDRSAASSNLPPSRRFLVLADGDGKDKHRGGLDAHVLSGALAQAEFERMRKEIDNLKKAAANNKKVSKNQAKKIEELKAQVLAEHSAKAEHEMQVQTLKAKCETQAELITTLEHSLQCQICMDLLHKPYVLSPCGHVLCLHCLQEWFRKAPPSADDSDVEDEGDPLYILTRPKSCPCCRAVVAQRPVPIFVVKSVSLALAKHKFDSGVGSSYPARSPSPDDGDPWKGIFRSNDDDDGDGDGDDDDDDADEEENYDSSEAENSYEDTFAWSMHGLWREEVANQLTAETPFSSHYEDFDITSESGSGDDDDEDEEEEEDPADSDSLDEQGSDRFANVYVPAQWQPPSVFITLSAAISDYGAGARAILPMLRRGCTLDMIRIFRIAYVHHRGLVAHLHSLEGVWSTIALGSDSIEPRDNRIFLGWNVKLHEADPAGELYMEAVLQDLKENPAQWTWTERMNIPGRYDVQRLVRAEDIEDYDTTDTEVWLDSNDSYR